jgi:uncharacterized membrane protein YfcA
MELKAPRRSRVYSLYILIGVAVGILVGFMGIGGGVLVIPAMVYILKMDQHMAQGTSLFLQLPPLGLGALLMYRKKGQVDMNAGLICALGILIGGYFGSKIAIGTSSRNLHEFFGLFLFAAAATMWHKSKFVSASGPDTGTNSQARLLQIVLMACGVGIAGGLFGVGGGVFLVPLLVVMFGFEQHRAQGTSLVALVPPTGLLAFLNYSAAGKVDWTVGLWIMPGVFFGAMGGSWLAEKLSSDGLRRVVAVLVLAIGLWEALSLFRR